VAGSGSRGYESAVVARAKADSPRGTAALWNDNATFRSREMVFGNLVKGVFNHKSL
jgi:hypothetical protein